MNPDQKLSDLGISLPPPPKPLGAYKPVQQMDHLLYLSGTLPFRPDGTILSGKLGEDLSIADGQEAARLATLCALSAAKNFLGSLNRIEKVVRAVGYMNTSPSFQEHAQVMNGASDLLATIFGEPGCHARLALGATSLPKGAAIELELILQIK